MTIESFVIFLGQLMIIVKQLKNMPMEYYWILVIALLAVVIVFLMLIFRDWFVSRMFKAEKEKIEQEEVCREYLKKEICNLFFFDELKDYDLKLEELQKELAKLEKSAEAEDKIWQETLREIIDYAVRLKVRRN